jgi:hypothetical protein
MSGIYLRDGDRYVAMRETPYNAEDVLQELPAIPARRAQPRNERRRPSHDTPQVGENRDATRRVRAGPRSDGSADASRISYHRSVRRRRANDSRE